MKVKKEASQRDDVIEIPVGKLFSSIRRNPWIISTFILAVILIAVVVINFKGEGLSIVSSEDAASSVVSFINSNPNLQSQVNLLSSEREGQLYKIILDYEGQEVPIYTTLDGKFLVGNIVPLEGDAELGDGIDIEERKAVSEDDDAFLGEENAPVTIIEFSDYQCPYCKRFWSDTLPLIKENYIETGKVKFVYRDFPLRGHPMAQPAAEAAECIREKGGDEAYWEMHDVMFENQQSLTEENLKKWAKDIGYNIDSCLDEGKYTEEVVADMEDGAAVGVSGTPAFFVNGIIVEGALPYENFAQIIDAELEKL